MVVFIVFMCECFRIELDGQRKRSGPAGADGAHWLSHAAGELVLSTRGR